MRNPITWWVLVVLVAACMVLPYVFGVPPRRRRDWVLLAATLAFLTWLLAGFVSVRASGGG